MVQNQATMYQLDCDLSNSVETCDTFHHLYKKGFHEKASSQVHVQQNVLKNEHKRQGIKLKPLDVSKESGKKTLQYADKRNLTSLNPSIKVVLKTKQKTQSKIPVLQKSFYNQIQNGPCDSTLSAADRRQKFHQSHLHAISPCNDVNRSNQKSQNKIVTLNNFIPWYNMNYLPKINAPVLAACQKIILPPIKSINAVPEGGGSASQIKKKCLLGEITHFPALCNLNTKPLNHPIKSTVPYLPTIFPAAPPPSISTSLEQDVKKK